MTNSKALREELRKVSKSASSSQVNSPAISRSHSLELSQPNIPRRTSITIKNTPLPALEPEYLKNVVLKFLESSNRSQKLQLVSVLAMLLKFTPDELKLALKIV